MACELQTRTDVLCLLHRYKACQSHEINVLLVSGGRGRGWAFRHVPSSAKTVTAQNKHVKLTSSSVSHLLMLSVDWFSFSSSPCRGDKGVKTAVSWNASRPTTSGKCYSSNPTLRISSYLCFPAKLAARWWHTDVVFITTSCVYFLSWVEDEKPVHLAQSNTEQLFTFKRNASFKMH